MAGLGRPYRTYGAGLVLVFGLVLIADALRRGSAQASIVLIVPVLTGSSLEFLVGTLLTFVGLLAVFLTSSGLELTEDPDSPIGAAPRSGGVVLIGPVPIFFGEWRQIGRHGFWRWAAAGSIATSILILLLLWLWVRS